MPLSICLMALFLDLYPWHTAFRNTAKLLATLGAKELESPTHTVVLVTVWLARAGVGEEWRNRPFEPIRSYRY